MILTPAFNSTFDLTGRDALIAFFCDQSLPQEVVSADYDSTQPACRSNDTAREVWLIEACLCAVSAKCPGRKHKLVILKNEESSMIN